MAKIGELNGPWAALTKWTLTMFTPAIIAVLSWCWSLSAAQVRFEAFMSSGEQFSQSDARELRDELLGRQAAVIEALNAKIDANATRLNGLDRDTTRIITILERMEDREHREHREAHRGPVP